MGRYGNIFTIVSFVLLPIFCCASRAETASATYVSASRDSIARELTADAYSVLDASDVRVTKEAAASLKKFIENGAKKVGKSETKTARQNIKAFAEKLVSESSFDESTGGRIVDSRSFQAALSLCPLYPFC